MTFTPPLGLGNRHLQTILSSVGPRRNRIRLAFAKHQDKQQQIILNCHDGIRLAGVFNQAAEVPAKRLAILIHGWEGSADSSYMLSMSNNLLANGIDVFRLNLRDHGDTHHLNQGLFNSTLVPEVISGLEDLQSRMPYPEYFLVGFSLGGNFSARVAALAHDHKVRLDMVIAFCPALHAGRSNHVLNARSNIVYGQYFVRKWKQSLYKKLQYFPEYQYAESLAGMRTLDQMNQQLIPLYTDFSDTEEYFESYAITGDVMQHTICPCYLHFAKDDMIIPWQDVELLADNPDIHITLSDKGGHCGFLMNWRLESWQDYRVLELIGQQGRDSTQQI